MCSLGGGGGKVATLLEGFVEVTCHVEGRFWVLVTGTGEEGLEAINGGFKGDELSWVTSEDLGHMEWLRKETFNLTGTGDGELILFGKIIHTKNGDNILERSVILDELLDSTGAIVMDLTDDGGVKHTGGGIEGIDGGIDTESGQITRQHGGGIQMSESGSGSWIGQIISGHIDGLDGSDGSVLCGGNTLLEGTHIGGEGGLISDSRWDTSEKGGHFRASLGESENVVDEKKHILVLFISEVLSDGESSKTDTSSGTRWLVHLTVHKGGLGSGAIGLDDTGLDHLVVKIVTLTSTLTDTGEHGETTVKFGDVVDKLHNEDGFTDTGTTEETNLTSLGVGSQKVDNLNTYIIIFIRI